jgi:hypothetical protein
MNWEKPRSNVYGFSTADALLVTDGYLLAKWNHSQCRGWQLYTVAERVRDQFTNTRWVAGAGADSLEWTVEQTIRWAEGMILQRA